MADRRERQAVRVTRPASKRRRTVQAERRAQQQAAQTDARRRNASSSGAVQAGARQYPAPPFPEQHQAKPGQEAALMPPPMYDAPFYRGSGKLEGKVALITGGDSGIGRAVAVLFAREGADIAITHLDEPKDADITRQAVADEGRRCLVLAGDVRSRAFCARAVSRTVSQFGQINVLVNNAAFQVHTKALEDLTEEHFDLTLKTNLYGYFHMARAAIEHMGRGDAIINTGSETGLFGSKNLIDYSMTKGGIHAFTKALAANVVERGIRVNAVAPGPVWTPLNPSDKEAEAVAHFGEKTLMKRPAQPEELAPAYVFLASPQCSSFITGEILPVLGGT
jgi:NAD(P)-dependent dehydrogenase (short-subunit alcohol dehydrogenase family)